MTDLSVSFGAPQAVVLADSPGLSLVFGSPQTIVLQEGSNLALTFGAPQSIVLTMAPALALVFPAPQAVVLQVQGIQGPPGPPGSGGGSGADSFETVSKNLSAIDNTGDQVSPTTLVVTYANGITKTIVDGGAIVTITLTGATPGGIDLVKTITLTGDDFAIVYS